MESETSRPANVWAETFRDRSSRFNHFVCSPKAALARSLARSRQLTAERRLFAAPRLTRRNLRICVAPILCASHSHSHKSRIQNLASRQANGTSLAIALALIQNAGLAPYRGASVFASCDMEIRPTTTSCLRAQLNWRRISCPADEVVSYTHTHTHTHTHTQTASSLLIFILIRLPSRLAVAARGL